MLQKLLGCLNYIHERAISPLLGCGMGCASRACGRACVCSRARVRMGACACACARAGARARAHVCACVRASCVRGSFLRVKQNVLVVRISEIIFRWGGRGFVKKTSSNWVLRKRCGGCTFVMSRCTKHPTGDGNNA